MEMNCREGMRSNWGELLDIVNAHHHRDILFSCKFVGILLMAEASFPFLFLFVKMNIKMYSTPNIIRLEGRGRQINKVHTARAISLVQLSTAEAFILMSHPLSHFSLAQCLIFTRLDLKFFANSVWLSLASKSLLEPPPFTG